MKRAKYVNESLDRNFDNEDTNWMPQGLVPDDDIDNAATNEVMAETSHALEELFQQAAENGLTFEMLRDLAEQALDQVDWVAAGQM